MIKARWTHAIKPLMACGLCASLVLTATSPVQAGPVLDRIKSSKKITIAYLPGSPFAYNLGEHTKPIGYTIDLCVRIAEAVRKSLELKDIDIQYMAVESAQRIPTIMSQKADLECGSTTNNEKRRQSVAFTVPHYITGTRFAVRSDGPVNNLRDLRDRKVAAVAESTNLAATKIASQQNGLNMNIIPVANADKAIAMVEDGSADAFPMDDVILYAMISELKDPSKMRVIGKFLTVEPLAIMLSKDDEDFKKIVDAEMKRLIHSREIYPLYEKWFEKPIPPKNTSLALPMNGLLKDFWKYPNDWVPN